MRHSGNTRATTRCTRVVELDQSNHRKEVEEGGFRVRAGQVVLGDVQRGSTNLRKTLRGFESAVSLGHRPAFGYIPPTVE